VQMARHQKALPTSVIPVAWPPAYAESLAEHEPGRSVPTFGNEQHDVNRQRSGGSTVPGVDHRMNPANIAV